MGSHSWRASNGRGVGKSRKIRPISRIHSPEESSVGRFFSDIWASCLLNFISNHVNVRCVDCSKIVIASSSNKGGNDEMTDVIINAYKSSSTLLKWQTWRNVLRHSETWNPQRLAHTTALWISCPIETSFFCADCRHISVIDQVSVQGHRFKLRVICA